MLNQETQETNSAQTPPLSVAQARVTPDELAAALAAIEARRQAEASRLAGTIPIEEAVSGLHLDSTPDEIWAEVQAQRARAEAERNPSVNPTFAAADAARREQLRQTQVAQQARQAPRLGTARRPNRKWMGIFTPFLVIWLFTQVGIIPNFWSHLPKAVPISKTVHVAKLSTLAQVPDGQEVYADSQTLVQISEGTPFTKITVDQNKLDNGWQILKIGGHVYLQGYILETDSISELSGKPLNVYNDDDSGELHHNSTSKIMLRTDKILLQKTDGNNDYSEITIPNFQPDPLTTLNEWR